MRTQINLHDMLSASKMTWKSNAKKSKLLGLENYDDTEIKFEIMKTAKQTALNRSTLGYQRKNPLKHTAESQTKDEVTFTMNPDESVT